MGHKGIILSGGSGTRLNPITKVVNKQLLPVYDKPMIYYPLSTLIEAGIKEILVISNVKDTPLFMDLLGDGSHWGVKIEYCVQTAPNGLAEAFIIGRSFIGDDNVTLILGDNIFWGDEFITGLRRSITITDCNDCACVFGYKVKAPHRYGVMGFDNGNNLNSLEEKPDKPKSNYAVIGMYTYPNNVVELVNEITYSARGELEITSLNELYLKQDDLDYIIIGEGNAWLDSGTFTSLLEASQFIETIQRRTGEIVGSPEDAKRKLDYYNTMVNK